MPQLGAMGAGMGGMPGAGMGGMGPGGPGGMMMGPQPGMMMGPMGMGPGMMGGGGGFGAPPMPGRYPNTFWIKCPPFVPPPPDYVFPEGERTFRVSQLTFLEKEQFEA